MNPSALPPLLLSLVLLLTGCDDCRGPRLRGSGPIQSETRDVPAFSRVDVALPARVYLTQGASQSVRIEAQPNVLGVLRTEVAGGELRVSAGPVDLRVDEPIRIYLTAQSLSQLSGSGTTHFYTQSRLTIPDLTVRLSGAGGGDLDLAGTGTLRTDLSGASELTLRGSFQAHRTTLSGASQLWAYDQTAGTADVDASGASTARLTVTNTLNVRASGGSTVYYKGAPTVNVDASGGSRVVRAD